MKIALYNWDGSVQPWEADDYRENDRNMVRVTEIMDVDFVELPKDDVVPKQVQVIEDKITEARVRFAQAIEVLENEKAKLLAIEDQS